MEKRTFVITGENGQPVAVINAESPQELNDKTVSALEEQYDGFTPRTKSTFAPKTIFESWEPFDLPVEVHDADELPEEVSFYTDYLSIQRCIIF